MKEDHNNQSYWQANIKLLLICMALWFTFSFLFGIILKEYLDVIRIGGAGLGFWFAQQGSIYSFLLIIIFYIWRMSKIEKQFETQED